MTKEFIIPLEGEGFGSSIELKIEGPFSIRVKKINEGYFECFLSNIEDIQKLGNKQFTIEAGKCVASSFPRVYSKVLEFASKYIVENWDKSNNELF